ncbi:hypothetical protein K438DRAFT_2096717 [Mycena galopus ATCC 62051]|nr:hypothetical protein K438DRAFT_2096717 [Mycena galopus ATCC 62051]
MDLGGHLDRIESDYVRPAKQFLTQSYEKYPTVTATAAIFMLTSFVPVVLAGTLALFASFLAVSVLLTVLVALGLALLVVLSSTLVFSAAGTVAVSILIRSKGTPVQPKDGAATEEPSETPGTSTRFNPLRSAFTSFEDRDWYPRKNLRSWRTRFFLALFFRNTFARIFLPRWMRAHHLYPYIFGFDRTPHPLKWVVLNTIRAALDMILTVGWLVLVVDPRVYRREGWRQNPAAETSPVGTEHPASETTRDEEVPLVVQPGQSAGSTGVSTTGGVNPDVRARNVAEAA